MQVVEEEFEPGFGAYIGFGIISLISVFILQLLCISIVDSLPRIYGWERGENVDAPRWLCIVIAFGLPILVPWAAASMVVRHRRLRWYFLACLILVSLVFIFVLGSDHLLDKAYRRGL